VRAEYFCVCQDRSMHVARSDDSPSSSRRLSVAVLAVGSGISTSSSSKAHRRMDYFLDPTSSQRVDRWESPNAAATDSVCMVCKWQWE